MRCCGRVCDGSKRKTVYKDQVLQIHCHRVRPEQYSHNPVKIHPIQAAKNRLHLYRNKLFHHEAQSLVGLLSFRHNIPKGVSRAFDNES